LALPMPQRAARRAQRDDRGPAAAPTVSPLALASRRRCSRGGGPAWESFRKSSNATMRGGCPKEAKTFIEERKAA
jgi:hypothetical protein